MNYIVAIVCYTGAAYILNKYGLNVIDEPFDFCLLMLVMSIGHSTLSMGE